ncbi:sugar ABC transporter permease, partial [Mesorhizobium sp. M7A.F.Ca.AU.001.01.1.1]
MRGLGCFRFHPCHLAPLAAVPPAGWPLARTVYFSFTDASLADLDARQWVGFANY